MGISLAEHRKSLLFDPSQDLPRQVNGGICPHLEKGGLGMGNEVFPDGNCAQHGLQIDLQISEAGWTGMRQTVQDSCDAAYRAYELSRPISH